MKKIIFLLVFFLSLAFFGHCQGAVSATSSSMNTVKMKAENAVAVLMLEIFNSTSTALTLQSVTVTVNSTGTATTTSGSFSALKLYSDDGDHTFTLGDTLVGSTSTVNIGSSTTIETSTTTTISPNEDKFFFVVLETSGQWTDNGYPESPSPGPQRITVSIASDGIFTSPESTNVNPLEVGPITADTHSQTPDISKISVFYDSGTGNYSLYDSDQQGGVGEAGTIRAYTQQSGGDLINQATLSSEGKFSLILGTQYYSSIWLSVEDVLGNQESSRVEFSLPVLPQIESIKAFSDRIIFKTNKNLRGDQAMNCVNYTINGSNIACQGPQDPFIDFFGNRVVIRNLNLEVGEQISFSISGTIQDIEDSLALSYSGTLTVEEASFPEISSISPGYGQVGDSVTISGTNFGSDQGKVLFSGGFSETTGPLPPVEATTISSWSNSQIVAVVPSGAKSGPVQVVTAEGVMTDIEKETFFDVLGNVYLKAVNTTSTQPITSPDNIYIFIGGPSGENIYHYTDDNVSFDTSSYVYTLSGISSMGFVWAYDASGTYLPALGSELQSNTSTSSPQLLIFKGTAEYKVSGTITLGESCSPQGQNKWVAVMAIPEGAEMEMGPASGIEPYFFKTGSDCSTTYTLALPQEGTYRIETHLPPWYSSQLMDPAAQMVTLTTSSKTASNVNFTFNQAQRRVRGRIVDSDDNPLSPQKYQELWIIAFQPKEDGKSSSAQPDSEGYFDLYLNEGAYKIEITGPMMPFSIQKDILVDSSTDFDLDDTSLDITIKLSPPSTYIEGYVKDGSGNGVSDVDVFCWCESGPGGGHAFTDSQGYYKMYVPPCSDYHIKGFARNWGELPEQTGIAVTSSQNPTVNFTLSSENFITISGQARKNDSSLAQADVWLTQGEFGPGIGGGRTDADGNYNFKIRKGFSNLYIHIALPGKGEIYQGPFHSGTLNEDKSLDVDMYTKVVEIHLKPGNTFENVFLAAHSDCGESFTDIRVSTSTDYDLYKMELSYESGGTSYIIDGGIPGFGPIGPVSINLPNETVAEINLNSVSFYTVSGTVSIDEGSCEDAFVWAGGPNGGGGTRVESDGSFSLKLREGVYDIGVGKTGYSGSMLRDVNVNSDKSGLSLSLAKNSTTIQGKVYWQSTPLENAKVWAENGQGGWSGAVSEADGSFILNVGSGEWKIDAVAEGYRLSAPLRVTAPASGVVLNLEKVDFSPQRKEQSIVPTQGGVIQASDTKIEIPSGALGSVSTDVTVRIQNTMNVPQGSGVKILSSKAKEINAYYSSGDNEGRSISILNDSVNIEMRLTKEDLESEGIGSLSQAQQMKISYYDSTAGNWVEIPTAVEITPSGVSSFSDLEAITLRASTNHFSAFAPSRSADGAPSTPSGLTATAGDGQVTLSWNSVSGAVKYYIYRKSGSQYPYLAQTTNTSYTDTGLTNGVTYYYKVSAVDSDGHESAASEAVSATPQESQTSEEDGGGGGSVVLSDSSPPSISSISVEVGLDKATISWQTNEPATSEINYGTSTDYLYSVSSEEFATKHSLVLENLLSNTLYHFQIRAKDEMGNESAYTDQTFTTLSTISEEIRKTSQEKILDQREIIKKQIAQLLRQVIILLQKQVLILLKKLSLLLTGQLSQ